MKTTTGCAAFNGTLGAALRGDACQTDLDFVEHRKGFEVRSVHRVYAGKVSLV